MKPNVVIIGGGTGTYVVTQALKDAGYQVTKIVTVFDSGGSTARLRDEFGFLPVGDLRQSLAALAQENGQSWIRELLLYRFDKGQGLEGHNLGNLILTALQDMTGSTPKALEIATKIFRLQGVIYPITIHRGDLKVVYDDGAEVVGEHNLDEHEYGGKKIKSISLTQTCRIYSKAREAIESADYIILGPGDVYASILPNFIVTGTKSAIARSKAKLVYIVNLMTRYTQTHRYSAADHVAVMEKYVGRHMDHVLVNTGKINPIIEKKYAKFHEYKVVDDLINSAARNIVRGDFASSVQVKNKKGDSVPRSLMRHDKDKIREVLEQILV